MAEGKAPAQGKDLYKNDCIQNPQKMELGKVEQYLRALPGWNIVRTEGQIFIERQFEFDTFGEADEFHEAYSKIVAKQNHDPEGGVRVVQEGGRKAVVPLRFQTHSVKGISLNDLIMAGKANHLLEEIQKKG